MKMSFTAENLAPERENFPKIKLANGESARIYAFETPVGSYVHNLRKPKIVNGRVQTVTDQKGNVGMDYEFVSNPICLGDPDTIKSDGSDPKNCPACKAVKDHGWDMFQTPKRKFAMHVFQYTTNGNANAPRSMSGDVKVWAFADKKFGELVAINNSFAKLGGLAGVDLQLGPCTNAGYQLYNVLPSPEVAWRGYANGEERLKEAIEGNQAKDLYYYIGRKMTKPAMEDKVAEIVTAHRQANGLSNESANDDLAGAENLDAGLAGILDDAPAAPRTTNSKPSTDSPADEGDFEEILKSLG